MNARLVVEVEVECTAAAAEPVAPPRSVHAFKRISVKFVEVAPNGCGRPLRKVQKLLEAAA